MSAVMERPRARALVGPPVMGICRNLLVGMNPADMHQVPVGVKLGDFVIESKGRPICKYNGDWLLPENWDTRTKPGDVVEWYCDLPQGREGIRLLLAVATVISIIVPGLQFLTPYLVAASLAYNLLVPPRPPTPEAGPGSVFSTSLAGNVARLDQAVWMPMGRVKYTPPYAGMPYTEFLPSDATQPTVDCDQYFYGVFAIGIGEVAIEKSFIGKTSLLHYSDVVIAQLLAPGEAPSTALVNVVTSEEVSSLDLPGLAPVTDFGRYVGGFAASRPGDKATAIGIDIAAPVGQGKGEDSITTTWQVETREINDYGAPVSEWVIIANEERIASTATPQRWSFKYELSTPIRCEIRIVRTNAADTAAAARDSIQWVGLRAYLEKPAPMNANCSHFEVVLRASQQLTPTSQRDFSIIGRASCRTLAVDLTWNASTFHRNASFWMLELLTSEVWGLGIADERIDLQSFYDLSVTNDARQDRFDYVLTDSKNAWEAVQLIATSCRARVFRRGIVYTVARDELVDVPVTAFTHRNTQPKSMKLHANLPNREQADGVVVQYQSNITWDTATIECPCPGFSVTNPDDARFTTDLPPMSNPLWIQLPGVTGAKHAEREGTYQAASIAYRRETVSCTVELEGTLVAFMDPIRWQPQLTGYGQSGDVAFWDGPTLVMGLTEPPDWSQAPLYLTLRRDDGTLTDPVLVAPGPTANDVVLPAVPDFDLIIDDGSRERPIYLLGPIDTGDELVKVTSIDDGGNTDGGAQLYDIAGMIDDDRVHEADNSLLPGPGDIQDPIDDGSDTAEDSGGGIATLVRLLDQDVQGGNIGLPDSTHSGGSAGFTLKNDGTLQIQHADDAFDIGSETLATITGQWINPSPVEPAVAALYECYFQDDGKLAFYASFGAVVSGTMGLWLSLDTNRSVSISGDDAVSAALFGPENMNVPVRVRIRRIGSPTILVTRWISLVVTFSAFAST